MRSRGRDPNKVKALVFRGCMRARTRCSYVGSGADVGVGGGGIESGSARVHVTKFKSGGAIVMRDASARFRCLAAKIRGGPRVR